MSTRRAKMPQVGSVLAEEAFLAVGAPVDGEVASWPGGGDGDGGVGLLVVAAAKRRLAARRAAVGLAADRGEGPLTDRAGPRRGIVPRRAYRLALVSRRHGAGRLVHQAAA
jgi:hypothetical protein